MLQRLALQVPDKLACPLFGLIVSTKILGDFELAMGASQNWAHHCKFVSGHPMANKKAPRMNCIAMKKI